MQSAPHTVGMQTMNQALAELYRRGRVTLESTIGASSDREELQAMIARHASRTGRTGIDRYPRRPGDMHSGRRPVTSSRSGHRG